ncbi:hypothetical protein PFUGPA_01742 [Plasmodium falciparum Palo Alto/Uganda]|uniref:Sexual stage-specific protein G37 n=1 Tax=Plasmodium falciparum (isolate Palo Alto / Uganda) TaxID=57270 RepID=W4J1P4_PLAFP|nr:hypothetical protein PFUGPA_01742 [Plasmodium falciparum Palo Alto/Uganda]
MRIPPFLIILFFVFYKKFNVNCIIQRQDVYLDDDFKSFTYFFASSPSADFLSRIVHSDDSRFVQIKNKIDIWSKTVDKAYAINQVSNVIMKVYVTLLLLLLLPYFVYMGIFGNTKNQTVFALSSILSYFVLLITFYLTNGILNIGFVCSLPLVFGLLKGNYYFILKIVHLIVLCIITLVIIKLFPNVFSSSSLQSSTSIIADKYMVSFLCALPVSAFITQIFFLICKTINPIDPSIFFMIPSSLNFMSISTIFSLTTWIITTCVLTILRNRVESDYNHILNIIAKLLYDVVTNLKLDDLNSFDYGISGYIYMNCS